MSELVIAGLTALSSLDYPGALAAVLFCQGCLWRCPYCHNPGLQDMRRPGQHTQASLLDWLGHRKGLLDAVVFSGGEPTLQQGLGEAMRIIKDMGFKVGLHTSGMRPQALNGLLGLVDWVGLDVKAPRRLYDRVTGLEGSGEATWRSLEQLGHSGVAYELRTTWHPAVLSNEEMLELAGELASFGAQDWIVQPFRPEGCGDPALSSNGPTQVSEDLAGRLEAVVTPGRFAVRGG